jgi:hypothetical protein
LPRKGEVGRKFAASPLWEIVFGLHDAKGAAGTNPKRLEVTQLEELIDKNKA